MSEPKSNHELLLRHLDGSLSPSEEAQVANLLRSDPAARAFLRDVAEQAVVVAETERTEHARRGEWDLRVTKPEDSRILRVRFDDWRWITAVAASVILMAGLAFLATKPGRGSARITEASGPLQWTGDGGQVRRDLAVGSVVSGGTLESLSVESWVVFKYRDGSQVTMSGPAAVTIAERNQKVLHLRSGSLSATVAPQPKSKPMIVHTQTADLAVLGTQFNVKADPAYTALNVNEGRVRVTRLVDGKVAEVSARHRVVASIDHSSEMMATEPPEPVHSWKSKLPGGAIYGKWQSGERATIGGLRSEPLFLKETRFGPLLLYVAAISVSSGDSAPVLLGPNARFRIRGRLPTSGEIGFGITTHFPNGGCSGKYATLRRVEVADPSTQTFDLELHLDELRPEEERSPRSAAGLTLEDCWSLTIHADKGLELLEVEILPD